MSWFEHGTSHIHFEETGAGTPVLFLPGLTESIARYSDLFQILSNAGYRVIAADLPGSGRSKPQPRIYPLDYYQQDARTMAALLKHLKAVPAHILGFSDGGEIAIFLAIQSPECVRSLVVWGAAGALSDTDGQLVSTFENLIDNPTPPMMQFRDHLVSVYGQENARINTQSAAAVFREIISRGGDISQSRAGEIKCPTLVIAGEHDPFAARALVNGLTDKIPTVKAEYLEGVRHDVYGAKPEWLTQTILDWLAAHQTTMATIDELLDSIFERKPSPLRAEFEGWVRGSRPFKAFAFTYQAKIRAKLKRVTDEGGLQDLRAELETAALLLREERFTVEYEKYAASKQRGPDFTVTFKTHTPFNLEVRRIRRAEWEQDASEARTFKLVTVLCEKLGQMPPSIVNLLWLTSERSISLDDLNRAVTTMRQLADRKDNDFFSRRGFLNASDFYKQFQRLSGIVLHQSDANSLWLNQLAKHNVLPEIAGAIQRKK